MMTLPKKFWKGKFIESLYDYQIFCFGSNPEGRHGAGAAKAAINFGAIYGQGRGLMGNSYGLVTKNLSKGYTEGATGITYERQGLKSVSKEQIIENIRELYKTADKYPNKEFFIAYQLGTKLLNGFSDVDMCNMFLDKSLKIPKNIVFHESFYSKLKLGCLPEELPKNDGITHINVYSKSLTNIGRQLTNFANTPFTHKDHGNFQSVEGYWYWLKSGSQFDNLRNLHGFLAKKEGRIFVKEFNDSGGFVDVESSEFQENVKEAIRCKMRQNKNILVDFVESGLPLMHYYFYGDKEKNPKVYILTEYNWMLDELERIRSVSKDYVKKLKAKKKIKPR